MPIIDIMRAEFDATAFSNPGAITNNGSWVTNNAVNSVALDVAAPSWFGVFFGPGGRGKFQPNDNRTILSAWVTLPYHFTLAVGPLSVLFYYGVNIPNAIPEIGSGSSMMQFPVVNSEISLGVYVPYRVIGGTTFQYLGAAFDTGNISQIGAPASLNGLRFYPEIYIKVLHNLALQL